ncbi:hypothetical protein [Chryseobacterium limigenitum]|uniref:LURP-one-related n=1 Tax=Chryseobacterium limigenitum TaxID=1612149 RepID=A0A1K2ITC5_9FLAO|nr:hypothetical protein [Chryseobacterium limigenitum]SFZ95615.1 hypothetical protein SAMN05216324_11170 [Chryseobacterium limigenitum]
MKIYTIKESRGSLKLLNEENQLVGEVLYEFVTGINRRIKIDNEIFKIKNTGFLWYDNDVFDKNGILVLKNDYAKNRIFYYDQDTEFFTYKFKGWFNKKLYLYNNGDQPVLMIGYKQKIFKNQYIIEVGKGFTNYIVILSLLNFYISELSSA